MKMLRFGLVVLGGAVLAAGCLPVLADEVEDDPSIMAQRFIPTKFAKKIDLPTGPRLPSPEPLPVQPLSVDASVRVNPTYLSTPTPRGASFGVTDASSGGSTAAGAGLFQGAALSGGGSAYAEAVPKIRRVIRRLF